MLRAKFTLERAKQVGDDLKVDWTKVDLGQFRQGLEVELEHGTQDPATNVTNDDLTLTGKIALAHLNEIPDYYTRLHKMERKGDHYWARVRSMSEKKEQYVNAVSDIREIIAILKNQIESVKSTINRMHHEILESDFSGMKKSVVKRAEELEARCRKELDKVAELEQKVLEFDKKVEEDFSHRRERIRGWIMLHQSRLSSLLESSLKRCERIKKEFQEFILEVQKAHPEPLYSR